MCAANSRLKPGHARSHRPSPHQRLRLFRSAASLLAHDSALPQKPKTLAVFRAQRCPKKRLTFVHPTAESEGVRGKRIDRRERISYDACRMPWLKDLMRVLGILLKAALVTAGAWTLLWGTEAWVTFLHHGHPPELFKAMEPLEVACSFAVGAASIVRDVIELYHP